MSKRCPSCGNINEDGRIFCSACGDPLDAELRLIQDLEKRKHQESGRTKTDRDTDSDEEYVAPTRKKEEKKQSPIPMIILAILVVAAVAAWFFLK